MKSIFLLVTFVSVLIFSVNFIVDPYNITQYNVLDIKYKFARDDRTEKVNFYKSLKGHDNIIIGSSRVYSMNPAVASELLGGRTYNFGVGTATVEDHLGIIKYLIKNNKIPKNIIIGVDFYTFNKDVPPNGYFLKNKELNFLSFDNYEENYLGKFFSIEALRASVKTLKRHYGKLDKLPRFDENGWGGYRSGYSSYKEVAYDKERHEKHILRVKKEIEDTKTRYYSDYSYKELDPIRENYYLEIQRLCEKYKINLYLFTTPIERTLLTILENNKNTKIALKNFLLFLKTFKNFKNLYNDKTLYSDYRNFSGATHTSVVAGDLILQKVLK